MNDEFLKHAIETIDTLTLAEIKDGLAAAGIDVTNMHSGKLVSEVPFKDIWVGMEVVSPTTIIGKIALKIDVSQVKRYGIVPEDNWLRIEWNSGRSLARAHRELNNIKVK